MRLEDKIGTGDVLAYRMHFNPEDKNNMYHRCMWANFYLDMETGTLTICSDAADAAHRWPEEDMDFLRLMAYADGDYLMAKLFKRDYFDSDDAIRETVQALRDFNEDPDTRDELRFPEKDLKECIDRLEYIDSYSSEAFAVKAMDILEDYCSFGEDFIDPACDYSPQEYTTMEVFTEYLQPLLKEELERRRNGPEAEHF